MRKYVENDDSKCGVLISYNENNSYVVEYKIIENHNETNNFYGYINKLGHCFYNYDTIQTLCLYDHYIGYGNPTLAMKAHFIMFGPQSDDIYDDDDGNNDDDDHFYVTVNTKHNILHTIEG